MKAPAGDPRQIPKAIDMAEQFTTTCANCEREVKSVYQGVDLPDSGLYFSPNSMGYYAGFFDNFPPDEEDKFGYAICHDCSVVMMLALPGLAKRLLPHGGGHPIVGELPDPPCCAWAWTWSTKKRCSGCGGATTYVANHYGGWDERECSCQRLSS